MMESETPPPVSSPNRADDFEVSSRSVSPDQQVVRGVMKTLPEDDTSVAQGPGANNKGPGLSGLQSEATLGTNKRRSRSAGYIDEHAASGVRLRGTSYLDGYGG